MRQNPGNYIAELEATKMAQRAFNRSYKAYKDKKTTSSADPGDGKVESAIPLQHANSVDAGYEAARI